MNSTTDTDTLLYSLYKSDFILHKILQDNKKDIMGNQERKVIFSYIYILMQDSAAVLFRKDK